MPHRRQRHGHEQLVSVVLPQPRLLLVTVSSATHEQLVSVVLPQPQLLLVTLSSATHEQLVSVVLPQPRLLLITLSSATHEQLVSVVLPQPRLLLVTLSSATLIGFRPFLLLSLLMFLLLVLLFIVLRAALKDQGCPAAHGAAAAAAESSPTVQAAVDVLCTASLLVCPIKRCVGEALLVAASVVTDFWLSFVGFMFPAVVVVAMCMGVGKDRNQ